MAENVGGIFATASIDTTGIKPGMDAVSGAIMGVDGRLRDLKGRFVATGTAVTELKTQTVSLTGATNDQVAAIAKAISNTSAWANVIQQAEQRSRAAFTQFSYVDHVMAEIAEKSSGRLSAGLGKAGKSLEDSSKKSSDFARGMIELSRGIEDFTTGGFLGVLNNIPGIFTNMAKAAGVSVGALAGITTGVSLLATGAYILYRNWDDVTGLFEERNPFPASADAVDDLEESLKKVNKALDELRETESLDNEQLKRANDLLSQREALEKIVTEEKRKQSELERFRNAKSQEENERGSAFMTAVNGNQELFESTLKQAYEKRREREIRREEMDAQADIARNDAGTGTFQQKLDFAVKRKGESASFARNRRSQDVQPLVEDMVRRLAGGDPRAMQNLIELMNEGTGVLIGGEGFRQRLEENAPEFKEEREQRKLEAQGRKQGRKIEEDARKKREKEAEDYKNNLRSFELQDEAESEANFRKFQRGEKATDRAENKIDAAMRKNVREFLQADEEASRDADRRQDLGNRLRGLLSGGDQQGKSLSIEAYNESVKSTNGEDQLRQLQEINKTLREIKQLDEKKKGVVAIRR